MRPQPRVCSSWDRRRLGGVFDEPRTDRSRGRGLESSFQMETRPRPILSTEPRFFRTPAPILVRPPKILVRLSKNTSTPSSMGSIPATVLSTPVPILVRLSQILVRLSAILSIPMAMGSIPATLTSAPTTILVRPAEILVRLSGSGRGLPDRAVCFSWDGRRLGLPEGQAADFSNRGPMRRACCDPTWRIQTSASGRRARRRSEAAISS